MNNRELVAVLLLSVIGAAILGYIFAILTIPMATTPWEPEYPPVILDPEVIALFIIWKTVISSVNMALILLTLGIYLSIYREIKSKFTLGLIIMILLLLMNALASNPMIHLRFGYQIIGLGPFAILPDIFTTIALLILFYLSLE